MVNVYVHYVERNMKENLKIDLFKQKSIISLM